MDLSGGLNYEEYLMKSTEEQSKALEDVYKEILLSEASVEDIREIKDPINIMAFSEGYCPDCTAVLPFIKKFAEENSNIIVKIFPREGNKEMLEEMVGTARIPTILVFDKDMEPKGAYVEFPKALIEKMSRLNMEEQKKVVSEYRSGKYNSIIEEELVEILK